GGECAAPEDFIVLHAAESHASVAVIEPQDEAGFVPVLKPPRQLLRGFSVKILQHEVACKCRCCRSCEIQHRDKQQGPEGTPACRFHGFHRVEPHDHMGQPCSADHQCCSYKKYIPLI